MSSSPALFPAFWGNAAAQAMLHQLLASGRIPQTLLFEGPSGVGKATLARRFASALLGRPDRIEQDDLSLAPNQEIVADREKWTADKRNDEPLYFATHPDFVTFPPDGPLRQLSIPQMRRLRELAAYQPLSGSRRVFLIDHIDRANEQAANSLLKTLEEPPPYLILILTAENAYDLLPTIRSRSVPVRLAPLSPAEMQDFLATRADLDQRPRRMALAQGSPGTAISIDIAGYDRRRQAMLTLLEVSARATPFGSWIKYSESLGASKSEKLDDYLAVLAALLEDLLLVAHGVPAGRNADLEPQLRALAKRVNFPWIREALHKTNDLASLVRRNIQKSLALDAMAIQLSRLAPGS
ncbi:MAG: AAA family ATPase [Bryobacteraceae bacterium]|nr:AAA family ATPase [Bryobacteraceae bacterium]